MATAGPEAAPTPADAAAVPAAPARRALLVVFLVVAVDLLGFGIVLPLMPLFASDYLAGYSPEAKGAVIGGLFSAFSLMQFVFSPVWGRVSDRVGRRPVLLVGLAGSVVFYGLFAYASQLPAEQSTLALLLILASRVGAGASGATVGTAAAVIADSTTPERRSKGMALIGAAFGVGFTFGPLIAFGALKLIAHQKETLAPGEAASGLWAPGAAAALLSLGALVLAYILMPETLKPGPKRPRVLFDWKRSVEVVRDPAVGPLVLVYFLAIFAFANFEATLANLTAGAFKFDYDDNVLVFAFIGLVLTVVQGGVYRPLAGRRGEVELLVFGLALMLLGLGGVAAVAVGAYLFQQAGGATMPVGWLFYLSLAVAVGGFAFVNPSVSSLISKRADPTRQGEILGVNQSFSSLARILGPYAGNQVQFLHPSLAAPYLIAVAVLLGVLGLVPAVRRAGAEPPASHGE